MSKKKYKERQIIKKKRVLLIVFSIIIAFCMVYLETLSRQVENYKKAEEYYKKKDYKNAVVYYQTVLIFYTPLFSRYFKAAVDRLFEIGDYYKEKGEYKKAADTYAEIIHSISAIRSFYTPYKDIQEEARVKHTTCLGLVNSTDKN